MFIKRTVKKRASVEAYYAIYAIIINLKNSIKFKSLSKVKKR